MVQTGRLVAAAAWAALVAMRAVGALTLSHAERDKELFSPELDELTRPKGYDYVAARVVAIDKQRKRPPADVPADVQEQIREASGALPDRPELDAVGTRQRSRRAHHTAEHSLWLGGRYRQAMTNFEDVQYVVYMEVGGQTLQGVLDTGSFELVVIGDLCKECGDGSKYSSNKSANHRRGKLVSGQSYGSGDLWSKDAWDMVAIGPYEAKNQSFWEVTNSKMPVLGHSAFSSIVGIGPPETPLADATDYLAADVKNASSYRASGQPVPSDLEKKIQHRRDIVEAFKGKPTMLDTFGCNMFSLCIGREPKSDGYVIWNDTAPLVKPEYFRRVPVVGDHTWSVQLGSPKFWYKPGMPHVTEEELESLGCEHGCGGLLDSGTSLMAFPTSVLRKFYKVFQSKQFDCKNFNNLPSIQFTLGNHTFTLPPDVYVAQMNQPVPAYLQSFVHVHEIEIHKPKKDKDYKAWDEVTSDTEIRCNMMVMESTATTAHGPLWILGLPFFRNYYTTFEVGQHGRDSRAVHFAPATESCTPAAPEEDLAWDPQHPQLYSRSINPTKLYVSGSIQRALTASFVHL